MLAFFMLNHSANVRGPRGPRTLIVLGIGLFVLAGLDFALAQTSAPPVLAQWLPKDTASERAQFLLVLFVCGTAWLTILAAATWGTLLGIRERRRAAAADIQRRTAVALRGADIGGTPTLEPEDTKG